MPSTSRPTTTRAHVRPSRLAALLSALILLAAVAAGCGGGGGGRGTGTGGTGTGTGGTTTTDKPKDPNRPRGEKPGERPADGTVLKDLKVEIKGASATVTATIGKPTEVSLAVRRIGGTEKDKLGRVKFGPKSTGPMTATWDLRVDNKKLPPGDYEVQLKGRGTGNSKPVKITIP